MKARETFEKIRKRKVGWFNLNTRLTLVVAAEIVIGILAAYGLTELFDLIIKVDIKIPLVLEILIITLLVAMIATFFLSKIFFDPIKELRKSMTKVADGDFDVRLETKSSSVEIQEMYAGFNMMTQELRATEILQTDFVSNVSHEIKTPINAIEGYTTLLQGCEGLSEEQQEYVDKILFNTKRLSVLVGNILLLSKIENQTIRTNQTRYRLDEQIRQSIVALESAWEPKNIEFDVDLEYVDYLGNENLMQHVWNNLIGNAIKFGPQNGLIRIRLKQEEAGIVFIIEDHGPGLTEEAQKHIFDKFYQADSSHKQEGNGLGLALVKRILAANDGEIFAENIESGGSRFTVRL